VTLVNLVLDASAVVKLFREEEETHKMRQIISVLYKKKIVSIYAPSLLLVELVHALKKTEGLTMQDVFEALEALKKLHLNIVDIEHMMNRAVELTFTYNVTIYDAVYVALAELVNGILITYDKELLRKFPAVAKKASEFLGLLS